MGRQRLYKIKELEKRTMYCKCGEPVTVQTKDITSVTCCYCACGVIPIRSQKQMDMIDERDAKKEKEQKILLARNDLLQRQDYLDVYSMLIHQLKLHSQFLIRSRLQELRHTTCDMCCQFLEHTAYKQRHRPILQIHQSEDRCQHHCICKGEHQEHNQSA